MSSNKDMKLGIFIAAAGLIILFGKLGVFGFLGRALWPLVILIPGLFLHVLFFSRRASAAVLIPAGILTVYGLLLGFCNTWGWGYMRHLWPVLLLGVAVGLYEYAFYSHARSGGITAVAVILGVLSLVLLVFSMIGTGVFYLLGIILVAAGIWLMLGRRKQGSPKKWNGGW
ncbi:hypothetical protein [Paenibacillus camerounensis]|uniref:hypothetical protein n=1 Tax=Paenibacillus camerounensis TaxID=1243663 RepID=UPI0005A92882|nr:hypothetical protein [Paenibacillus camerounensis]